MGYLEPDYTGRFTGLSRSYSFQEFTRFEARPAAILKTIIEGQIIIRL
jgi:hypothetical protein